MTCWQKKCCTPIPSGEKNASAVSSIKQKSVGWPLKNYSQPAHLKWDVPHPKRNKNDFLREQNFLEIQIWYSWIINCPACFHGLGRVHGLLTLIAIRGIPPTRPWNPLATLLASAFISGFRVAGVEASTFVTAISITPRCIWYPVTPVGTAVASKRSRMHIATTLWHAFLWLHGYPTTPVRGTPRNKVRYPAARSNQQGKAKKVAHSFNVDAGSR